MLTVTERGDGLAVVHHETGQQDIQRELTRLDPTLFLDPERDPATGRIFWTVKAWVGSAHPPVYVLTWRTPHGDPLPLSHGILEAVKACEIRSDEDALNASAEHVAKLNEEHKQRVAEKSEADHEYVFRANKKRLSPVWSPGLHPRRFGAGA